MHPLSKLRIYLLQQQRRLKLSDDQVARRCGSLFSAAQYQALVQGDYAQPLSLSELVGLALVLDVPLRELLDVAEWSRLRRSS